MTYLPKSEYSNFYKGVLPPDNYDILERAAQTYIDSVCMRPVGKRTDQTTIEIKTGTAGIVYFECDIILDGIVVNEARLANHKHKYRLDIFNTLNTSSKRI